MVFIFENISENRGQMGRIVGSAISTAEAMKNMEFVKKSKEEANKYKWLYHCTSIDALFSMIEYREMWLSNMQVVNDKEEVAHIDFKEYEKSYMLLVLHTILI